MHSRTRAPQGFRARCPDHDKAAPKRVALDGKWQHVYADHIRFLAKKRHRVDGVRMQGYSRWQANSGGNCMMSWIEVSTCARESIWLAC
jgi:hypothetical protein